MTNKVNYLDDNYGFREVDLSDPDMVRFLEQTKRQSVEKVCADCGRTVYIKKEYDCCYRCADLREGGDW